MRGRVNYSSEVDIIEHPAVFLGEWLLVQIPEARFLDFVDQDSERFSVFEYGLPGLTLIDARKGWTYEPDNRTVRIARRATMLASDRLPSTRSRGRLCLALIADIALGLEVVPKELPRFRSPLSRLEIDQTERPIQLVGELFVQPTSRGYVPAIHVRMPGGKLMYVLVGAASLAARFEQLREHHGTLHGLNILLSKESDERTAKYVVREIQEK